MKIVNQKTIVQQLDDTGSGKISDEIYDAIDALLNAGAFNFLDDLLIYWEGKVWRTPLDVLLAYATATYVAKNKLPHRQMFIERCMDFYKSPELWKGLV